LLLHLGLPCNATDPSNTTVSSPVTGSRVPDINSYTTTSSMGSLAPTHNIVYLNSSLSSVVNLSTVLHLNTSLVFSFRTCLPATLLYQQGAAGNFFQIALTQAGSLNVSWQVGAVNDYLNLDGPSLLDNNWYTVTSNFLLGEIYVTVSQQFIVNRVALLSNSTVRRYLWSLDLSGGTPLQVGLQYTGCLQEGPQVLLSSASTTVQNVLWECPLEDSRTCGRAQIHTVPRSYYLFFVKLILLSVSLSGRPSILLYKFNLIYFKRLLVKGRL